MITTSLGVLMPAPQQSYRPTAKALHWIVALFVLATIPVGQVMIQEGLPRNIQNALFVFHKNIGVVILLLVVVRLLYRAIVPAPPLPAAMPDWQRSIARGTHAALYVLLLVMAVSGYVRVRAGGFPIEWLDAIGAPTFVPRSESLATFAKATHFYTRILLIAVVALHVGAALNHAFVKRDGVFQRMWPRLGRRS